MALKVYVFVYGIVLLLAMAVALAVPIDRSRGFWKIIGFVLGALFLSTFISTCWLLQDVGFISEQFYYDNGTKVYTGVFFLTFWF